MIMLRGDQTTFPKLTSYVKDELPKVSDIDTIVNGFRNYAQMDRPTLQRALAWGNQPTLMFLEWDDKDKRGVFGEPNEIHINIALARAFEIGRPRDLFTMRNARGDPFPFIGAIILHELVHWGDYWDDINQIDYPGEEGNQFMIDVYGLQTAIRKSPRD
jgi:Metallopeptidase toxin 3